MTRTGNRAAANAGFVHVLHRLAMIALPIGAVASVALMLYAGRHNPSRLLALLFTIWVLSPFVAAFCAEGVAKRWSILTRTMVSVVALIFTLASLAVYGGVAFGHLNAKIGFVFLVVPFASWLLMGVAVGVTAFLSRAVTR